MKNILILYNPYYQENVIEQHLEILKDRGSVAFGKLKSKLRDYEHPYEDKLESIYSNTSQNAPLQLFLTDYNSIYVANVIAVKTDKTMLIKAPTYYENKDVEKWYIINDLRLIVDNNFQLIRDKILANFKATNFNNHTYAIYGNKYVYPMEVTMKEEINYFLKDDENFKYYTDIFKSELELQTKQNLINFTYGSAIFYSFTSNSQDNIISAEIEYHQNKHNPLYDFSTVVVKYSKILELELYIFMKTILAFLMEKDNSLEDFSYSVQNRDFILIDILKNKPNYGTYRFVLKSVQIQEAVVRYIENSKLRYFILKTIP
ncbi:MAG: HP0729 family protein, partial [Campylobacterota bacterium]|nr:HP0729 family protein [Campylobacterota bacterium]